jgi:4-alpha-glucanotransferase
MVAEEAAVGDEPAKESTAPVVDAAISFVAHTGSVLCLVPLEDLLGQEEQPNLPGTVDEHPNWRRRSPGATESVFEQDAVSHRINLISQARPRQ